MSVSDLPVTPKLHSQEKIVRTSSWTTEGDVTEALNEEPTCVWQLIDGVQHLAGDCKNQPENPNPTGQTNAQKLPLTINNINIGKHFQHLGDASDSVNAQNNLAQTLLILDALNIGLNDLEDVVSENSELKDTLKLQKEQLHEVLKEIEFGVSRAMDKIASNILFRVQKLERSFEKEWCELEKSGHKDELKGLFYECPEFVEKEERYIKGDYKHPDKSKDGKKYEEKSKGRYSSQDDYHYEVDKDSTGKYYRKSEGKEFESNEYIRSFKKENPSYEKDTSQVSQEKESFKDKYSGKVKQEKYVKYHKELFKKREQATFQEQNAYIVNDNTYHQKRSIIGGDLQKSVENNEKINFEEDNQAENNVKVDDKKESANQNHYKLENEEYNSKSFKSKDKCKKNDNGHTEHFDKKESYNFKKPENHKYKHEQSREKKYDSTKSHYEDRYREKSAIDKIAQYLKETCNKIGEKAKHFNLYEKLRKSIDDKAKISIDLFNKMFEKYCKVSGKEYNTNNFNKENLKGEFRGKSYEKREFSKDFNIIEDPKSNSGNVFEFNIEETTNKQEGKFKHPLGQDRIIEPTNKYRQWTFSSDEPIPDNKTKNSGDWFLKAGNSRSKARW